MFYAHLARFQRAPLTTEQRADVAPELRRMAGLTPGDFAAVARRMDMMGDACDAAVLVEEVVAELRAKGADGRRVGF